MAEKMDRYDANVALALIKRACDDASLMTPSEISNERLVQWLSLLPAKERNKIAVFLSDMRIAVLRADTRAEEAAKVAVSPVDPGGPEMTVTDL